MTDSHILSLREQDALHNEWLAYRLEHILPKLMQRTHIDLWIVLSREYNEDPVMFTLLPATSLNASRLTGFVYALNDEGQVDCYSISSKTAKRYAPFYKAVWAKGDETQFECLARLIADKDPQRIGIDVSETFALADGLSKTLYDQLVAALNEPYRQRLVSAEELAVGWLETRSPLELAAYPELNHIAHGLIAEAFSKQAIEVGVTTTTDLEYYMLQRAIDLGLGFWFHFDVDIQRHQDVEGDPDKKTVRPGDLLHCDVGICYKGLKTDTQRLAYVLKEGETDAPEGLKALFRSANQFQDIVSANFCEGRTGNEILAKSLTEAKTAGLNATLYNHPIGVHGHAAGTIMGLWDHQEGVPGRGDYPLYANTCHALELNTKMPVPEWDGKVVQASLEQTVAFTGGEVVYLDGRQTTLILV